jgi:cyanate permease
LLIRQELELAKNEMRDKGKDVLPGIGLIGGALVAALCAAGALTAFVVVSLALFLDEWLAALLTGLALLAVGGALAWVGKKRVEDAGAPLPERTIDTVREDVAWMKERAQSARR